jgi:hypothetical protein
MHAIAANDTWTPPASMNERIDTKTTSTTFIAVEQNDVLQPAAAAVSKTATAVSTAAVGAAEILTLRGQAATTVGTTSTVAISGPNATPQLVTNQFSTTAETFNLGDRLELDVVAPNDTTNCNTRLTYDGSTQQSKLTVATMVPEGVAGLLLLAPMLPIGLRWMRRRRP